MFICMVGLRKSRYPPLSLHGAKQVTEERLLASEFAGQQLIPRALTRRIEVVKEPLGAVATIIQPWWLTIGYQQRPASATPAQRSAGLHLPNWQYSTLAVVVSITKFGFDHGVGHPLLFLCDAQALNL
jgi:hypothetical protein